MPAAREKKMLLQMLAGAGLSKGTTPGGAHTMLLQQRYPWLNRAMEMTIRLSTYKHDDDFLDFLDQCVYWNSVDLYRKYLKLAADEFAVPYHSPKLREDDIQKNVLLEVLKDRARILRLRGKPLRDERLRTLNEKWKRIQLERSESDPLGSLRRANFGEWLKKASWDQEEFLSLLLGIEPGLLGFNEIDLATPYSLVGEKAKRLTKTLELGIDLGDIKFPDQPKRLLEWARNKRGLLSVPLLAGLSSSARIAKPKPLAGAVVDKILLTLEAAGAREQLPFVKQPLLDLIDEAFGHGKFSENAFTKALWEKLPKSFKSPGKPKGGWKLAWAKQKPRLLSDLIKLRGSDR